MRARREIEANGKTEERGARLFCGCMNTKTVIAVVALVILGVAVYFLTNGKGVQDSREVGNTSTSGMLAEKNAVVVLDQRPGSTITVAEADLAAPGYVVIHEEANGAAGAILGASALLGAGVNRNVPVKLERASRDGETLYAMLHAKGSGASFNAEDAPVQSSLGGPLMGSFEISSSADTSVQVQI